MHELTEEIEQLARSMFERVLERQRMDPMPLGGIGALGELEAELAGSITAVVSGSTRRCGAGRRR